MPKCILAVDDDPVTIELIKRTLQSKEYEVITAANGQDALDVLKEKTPDLILLDVQMPIMNGYSFILEKSHNPALAGIPVIVLTASQQTEPVFKRHGVKAYLLKPINVPDMLEKIQAVFSA